MDHIIASELCSAAVTEFAQVKPLTATAAHNHLDTAVLSIGIADTIRLVEIFGEPIALQAFSELGAAAQALMKRLLVQHEILAWQRLDSAGRWTALFRIRSDGILRDPQEVCESLQAAGRALAHALPLNAFGAGTGMRVHVTLAAQTLSSDLWPTYASKAPGAWPESELIHLVGADPQNDAISAQLANILSGHLPLLTVLQPIVRMSSNEVIGYEALTRGPVGSLLARPDQLFHAASNNGCEVAMELLCAELALQRTKGRMPRGRFLTINLGPQALQRAATVLPLAGRNDVIFELTEHLPLDGAAQLIEAVGQLRAMGIGLALDDTGCGFADMETVRILRPDIVKLCITVVRHAGQAPRFDMDIAGTVQRLQQWGYKVLAEGVETQEQHEVLSRFGTELGQGWLYGRPATIDDIFGSDKHQFSARN